jgi:hypothetical protein
MGTALLAKAADERADVFSLKVRAGTPGAYSARALAMNVLVPASRELKMSLGVTGREPINNQPYFHNDRVTMDMNAKATAKEALAFVYGLLGDLSKLTNRSDRLGALAAFIEVRRRHWVEPKAYSARETSLQLEELIQCIESFVAADSEGGRRAQAVAAGLVDVLDGPDNVETSRVNDPDRNFPGDVAAFTGEPKETRRLARAVEVRDKPITASDVRVFVGKAAAFSVARAVVLAVAPQQPIDLTDALEDAEAAGIILRVFPGWRSFIRQIFFWLPADVSDPVTLAHQYIYNRLVELECSTEAQNSWLDWRPSAGRS